MVKSNSLAINNLIINVTDKGKTDDFFNKNSSLISNANTRVRKNTTIVTSNSKTTPRSDLGMHCLPMSMPPKNGTLCLYGLRYVKIIF